MEREDYSIHTVVTRKLCWVKYCDLYIYIYIYIKKLMKKFHIKEDRYKICMDPVIPDNV